MRSYIIFSFLIAFACAGLVDKVFEQAGDAIERSRVGQGKIRECTCDEKNDCIAELESQGIECVDTCWNNFDKATTHSKELRTCFRDAEGMVKSLITCVGDEAAECTKEKTDNQVEKVDINQLLDSGTQKLLKVEKNMTALFVGDMKKVVDTLTNFGVCIKDCVVQKNSGGFCFDKKQCQLKLLSEAQAKKAAKKCSKQVEFRKHIGEICECGKKVGIKSLGKFCPLIQTMS